MARRDEEAPVPVPRDVTGAQRPKNRREALELLAERVGGTLSESKVTGAFAVSATHGSWPLTLDLHMVSVGFANTLHTRVWAAFHARTELRLVVRRRTFFDSLARRVGLGGSALADRSLARTHVVRGRPAGRVRGVLSAGLADAVTRNAASRIEVKRAPLRSRRALGPDARLLEVLAPGVDTDVDRMAGMFDAARLALDALLRAGVASAEGA
jgi:hypothetical protein